MTSDFVMFDEAIAAFRPPPYGTKLAALRLPPHEPSSEERAHDQPSEAYVLLDFAIPTTIDCGEFTLGPTSEVTFWGPHGDFSGPYGAFVAPVSLPSRIAHFGGHLFALAVSALVSFTLMRPAKSPRSDLLFRGRELTEDVLLPIGLQFPVVIVGIDAHDTRLSNQTLENYGRSLAKATSLLCALPYSQYERVIRAMRLVQLAHNNMRDDFSLAYYLIVSAIETVAQKAIQKEEVKEKDPKEAVWELESANNETVQELLEAYRKLRKDRSLLSKRFVKFVLEYCPPSEWMELEHPDANRLEYLQDQFPSHRVPPLPRRPQDEKYPSDLSEDEIEKMIKNLYRYRSNFTHEGLAPPHRDPSSSNRYIQKEIHWNPDTYEEREFLLPTFRLISFIAQRSILKFAQNQLPEDC